MDNREADQLLTLIRQADPDLVLAIETDDWWTARLDELAAERPYVVARPLANTYGMLLYSRLPLEAAEVRFLLHDGIPSIRSGVVLRSGERMRLYAVHPEPPSPTEADTSLGRDAELVIIGREVARANEPAIVAGDLNDVGWSRTSRLFRRLSQLLDPRIGRGMFCTFHAGWPFIRWPLDHAFVSADFLLRDLRCLPAFGSDHFPIFIALDYAPKAVAVHEPPEPVRADLVEARETVSEAKVAVAAGSLGSSSSSQPHLT
jgi:endonuclease/exonuclease/phosphatase (EEP) superfamily protein YafD